MVGCGAAGYTVSACLFDFHFSLFYSTKKVSVKNMRVPSDNVSPVAFNGYFPWCCFSALEILFHPDVTLTKMADRYPDVLGYLKDDPALLERVQIEGGSNLCQCVCVCDCVCVWVIVCV